MRNRTLRQISGAILAVLLSGAASQATVRYVARDGTGANGLSWTTAYKTIDAALRAASTVAGDEIHVKQGTYGTGSTVYVTKAVKIYGGYSGAGDTRDPEGLKTTIDGLNTATHCFDISADVTVDGFTITKGRANGSEPSDEGGALYIHQCTATVSNCVFQANVASYIGGAISLDDAGGTTISNCSFVNNRSTYVGGAILCYYSDVTIEDCNFEGNKTGLATRDGYGGAIYNDTCAPTITGCTFSANSSQYGAGVCNYMSDAHIEGCTFADCNTATIGGGGVYNWGGSPTISECLFQDNRVTHRGGAIFDRSLATVTNCILWNNRSMTYGGAIHIDPSTEGAESCARFVNCTVYGNSAYQGGGLYSDNASAVLVNCILWGNIGYDEEEQPEIYNSTWVFNRKTVASYCDIAGDTAYPGTGNIRSDPRFVNAPGGDFHLQSNSPCIDHGTNSASGIPSTDYDGRTRIEDGDGDGLAVADMGVYERESSGPVNHVYRGEILQGLMYEGPSDTTASYMFMLQVETDGSVDSVEFRSPAGNTFTIPDDEHTSSGDGVETHHVVSDGVHTWQYWAGFDSATGLNSYGTGTYIITYHLTGGTSHEGRVDYSLGGTPIPQPSQKPNVTDPAFGASVTSPVGLTWGSCTDASANAIFLTVINAETDETVDGDTYGKDTVASNLYALDDGTYIFEVSFANLHDTTDNGGVPFEIGKAVTVDHVVSVAFTTVYRFWSPVNSVHFYTISAEERDNLIANFSYVWTFEGPAYHTAAAGSHAGLAPVYRFWSGHSHFYTISESEKDMLIRDFPNVWTYEGIAFYAFPDGQQPSGTKPVYRFWNGATICHFYTISEDERDMIIRDFSTVWTFEGIAYYAYE